MLIRLLYVSRAVDKNDKAVIFYNTVCAKLKSENIPDGEWDGTIEMREK